MKLERTLIELSALVEYGTKYLLDVNKDIKSRHPLDVLPHMNPNDILVYAVGNLDYDKILDEMNLINDDEVKEWIRSTQSVDDVFYCDDIKDYVAENYDIDDVYDDYDIEDFCSSHYSIDEIYSEESIKEFCRDNYEAEDVYDLDGTEMSLSDFMESNDMSDYDVLDCINMGSIKEYVSHHVAVADMVEWK